MTLWSSIKPFWPLLFTFILPRALNYYRALKVAYRTRPPPRPLDSKTTRGLNALFGSICTFLYASWPNLRGDLSEHNVFVITQSRLGVATDVLFQRLALLREGGRLIPVDETLRSKLTSPALRQLYLRFGPSTLLGCQFCHADDPFSYLLYHLPTNTILPHLFHIFTLGLATSETLSGYEASTWRHGTVLGALVLAGLDVFLTTTYAPVVTPTTTAPAGTFWIGSSLRYLSLVAFDAAVAFLIYASATRRFYLFPALAAATSDVDADPELSRRRTEETVTQATLALQMAGTNLRAYSIARNAVVRNPGLKATDDEYWRTAVAMEGGGDESVLAEEEVQAAIARAYGSGGVDVENVRREAEAFVRHATRALDGGAR
ncbi:hypothetical protein G647_07227 [Cladophialophora carrionii CBS 160.54]|uniref:Uncharacterized protein n=1 Tax=Cladophialophora carrionii CBS 160.54 TaxID=1279043 RepID=V9D1V2_9EURO|nr:uncharacterized protein G647_07227 [Cladophialophora carrionii CBS 160.54]ETI20884.1 hypothetical protein G647_07227 [Cladophialophora carrionii CBS 160.54]